MDKGDYISIIHLNEKSNNTKECSWKFDASLPAPFGRQTSTQVKQYNRDLFAKQFPETEGSKLYLNNKRKEKLKQAMFSPKNEYKLWMTKKGKHRNEKHLKAFSDIHLQNAPAWSLGSRSYPPDDKDNFSAGGTHDLTKVN